MKKINLLFYVLLSFALAIIILNLFEVGKVPATILQAEQNSAKTITQKEVVADSIAKTAEKATNTDEFNLPPIKATDSDPQVSPAGYLVAPSYTEVKPPDHEALFYEKLPKDYVKCKLCPWECVIKPGERGICGVRLNKEGKLITLCYARPCTIHIDPIEKKPFFHFYPGAAALSLASAGCNLACKFCQNWDISQAKPDEISGFYIPPDGMIRFAKRTKSNVISITYSEPVVNYEYMLNIARLA
ncbi:MAG: hypothetical protein AB1633_11125, partial [Elusimicrobiota bacterium]